MLACDPLVSDWPSSWQTTSLEKFVEVAKRAQRCALFVDESGMLKARKVDDAEWLLTTARHWGHLSHFLCQGGVQLSPTMRAQFSTVFLFGCTPRVAEMWAEEFNEPGLLAAPSLPRYQFLFKKRYEPLRRMMVAP